MPYPPMIRPEASRSGYRRKLLLRLRRIRPARWRFSSPSRNRRSSIPQARLRISWTFMKERLTSPIRSGPSGRTLRWARRTMMSRSLKPSSFRSSCTKLKSSHRSHAPCMDRPFGQTFPVCPRGLTAGIDVFINFQTAISDRSPKCGVEYDSERRYQGFATRPIWASPEFAFRGALFLCHVSAPQMLLWFCEISPR